MFESIINLIQEMNFTDLFQTFGAIIALVLGILTLSEFKKKRVDLKIDLTKENFISHQIKDYNTYDITEIDIKAELINRGLEPTTINGVHFLSDYDELNNIDMSTSKHHTEIGINLSFEPIRLEANDRRTVNLIIYENILLPNNKKNLNAALIFRTTHKDIKKKIVIERNEPKEIR